MTKKVEVLAIAAHRDDLEICSGGLIAKFVDLGYKVGMLDLTAGEMGSQGDAETRLAESTAAAKILGVMIRENLGLPDAYLENNFATRALLAQQIRDFSPSLIIVPHWQQRHPDHRVCSQLSFDACHYAGLKKAKLTGEPHRPKKILYSTYYEATQPSFIVDVSAQYDRKLASIRCYHSQFKEGDKQNKVFAPGFDLFEFVRANDGALGSQIRVQYAEAYVIKEFVAIDDPMKLGGTSI
ncbi:MAG: bacillithiol biosynthesis deacetylase BshB1 [Candidatus Zixiibacteriota bacterium]